MKLEIQEASNGWIIKSNEDRKEPAVFQFDGKNRFRTPLDVVILTAQEALQYILNEMIQSHSRYKINITEEIEEIKNERAFDGDAVAGPVPTETLSG